MPKNKGGTGLTRRQPELVSSAIAKVERGIGKGTMGSLVVVTGIVVFAEGQSLSLKQPYLVCFPH